MVRYLNSVLLIKAIAAAVVFCTSVYTFFLVGPALETQFLPVITEFRILEQSAVGEKRTRLMVVFRKARSCEYLGVAWFRGRQKEVFERVPIVLLRGPEDQGNPNRPLGYQRAGPWIIDVPLSEVEINSFAETFHKCHLFWVTRTHLFP